MNNDVASTPARPALLRQLGVTSATALVISSMIGMGIFGTTGFLAGQLGSPALVLSIWAVGAVGAFIGAMCYAELGVNFPSSGGEYVYLTRAFGPTWGFMTGWVSFFAGFSAPIAGVALAFADYLGHVCAACTDAKPHVLAGSGDWTLQFGKPQMIACAAVVFFTVLNVVGVQRVARAQNVLTAAKILILLAFIGLGFAIGNGSWQNFSMHAVRTESTPIAAQFAISLFWIYVSYSGWNAATYVAEELRQPARTLPMALALGTTLVAALYLILNVVFIYAAPLEVMKNHVAVGALAAAHLFGPNVGGIFSALMALSLLATHQRADRHRTARLLRHGEERRIFFRGGESASALAHSGDRDCGAGRLHHGDDADSVSPARQLHRIHAELFRRDERRVSAVLPPPPRRRLAKAARSESLLPAVARRVPAGRSLDDHSRHPVEAVYFARRGGDGVDRRSGLSLAHPLPHSPGASG